MKRWLGMFALTFFLAHPAHAATVTFSEEFNAELSVDGQWRRFTVLAGSSMETMTVNQTSVAVIVAKGETFTFRSYDRFIIKFRGAGGQFACEDAYSQAVVSGGTVEIIPTKDTCAKTPLAEPPVIVPEPQKPLWTPARHCPIKTEKPYHAFGSALIYYITPACTKLTITSPELYYSYFKRPRLAELMMAGKQELALIPNDSLPFLPWGPLYWVPEGSIIKTPNGSTIYQVEKRKKRLIANEEVFRKRGYAWNRITIVHPDLLATFPQGTPITQ